MSVTASSTLKTTELTKKFLSNKTKSLPQKTGRRFLSVLFLTAFYDVAFNVLGFNSKGKAELVIKHVLGDL